MLALANTGSCVGLQNKRVTLLDADSRVECPFDMNRLQNMWCFVVVVVVVFWVCVPRLWIEFESWFERKKRDLRSNDLWNE